MEEQNGRDSVRSYIEVSKEAKELLDNLLSQTRLPMVRFMSALVEWVVHQDRKVVVEILSKTGDAAAELVRQRLGEMAAAKGEAGGLLPPGAEISIEDALRVIRLMTDRIEEKHGRVREETKRLIAAEQKTKKGK